MYLASRKVPNWTMQSTELLEILGFKSGKIPATYSGVVNVVDGQGDDNMVSIDMSPIAGRRKARVRVSCAHCEKMIPFGRIRQHVKTHNEKTVPADVSSAPLGSDVDLG